ncbi:MULTISPECIES: NAD(P)-dependent oxidoreductase [Streptomyces]|uniref:NAD(P)-dependent oxidoreductase n=1 Tax=Streptomyces TaxID=1883 RepID=UPI001F419088|nr:MULTISPECIES: NAD(P)H-binding protein [Streptomyces]
MLGATGMVGSRVIDEARTRGHRVLALSRKPANLDAGPDLTAIAVDARDPAAVREAFAGSAAGGAVPDAIVLTVRTEPVDQAFLIGVTRTALDVSAELGARLLVVGGAGTLRSPGGQELLVADDPVYVPAQWRAVATAGIAQLRTCQAHAGADWAYLSPPALLEPGARTGRYLRGGDTLLTGTDGRSWISAEDLAVAAVDEIETPGPDRHLTVVHRGEG